MVSKPVIETAVFHEVAGLLAELVGELDVLDIEITRETTFHEDLQLESVDLVSFAAVLQERFGVQVNLAQFLAEKELDEVIGLRVGEIVAYVEATVGER